MTRCIAIVVAALALFIAPGVRAQTAKWDQTAVTAAAAEFETAVSGLRESLRQAIARSMTPDKSRMYRIMQDLRQIEWLAQSLHGDLVKGEGMEATAPIFYQIQENRTYAKNDAMFVDITAPIQPKIETSRASITKLSAYYPPAPGN